MASTATPQSRVNEIGAKIRGACLVILQSQSDAIEQRDALNGTLDTNRSARLQAMLSVAKLSAAEKWFSGEIMEAVKIAAKSNDPEDRAQKALATFISEMKTCADPKVRDQFPALVSSVETAWQNETLAIKIDPEGAPTPLRKLWARSYHAVCGLAVAAKKDGLVFNSVQSVVTYAEEHDPAYDVKRVEKRIKKIVSDLQAMFQEFPHDELKTAADYLDQTKAEHLIAARNAFLATLPAQPQPVPAPAGNTTVGTTPDTTANDEIDETAPAEGVVDIDEILGDAAGDAAGDVVRMAA